MSTAAQTCHKFVRNAMRKDLAALHSMDFVDLVACNDFVSEVGRDNEVELVLLSLNLSIGASAGSFCIKFVREFRG